MNGKLLRLLLLFSAALSLRGTADVYVPGSGKTEWRYHTGDTETKNWQAGNFDDAQWTAGKGPVAADSKSAAAWLRNQFDVAPDKAGQKPLLLTLRSDAATVVYLNGKELVRVEASAAPAKVDRRGTHHRSVIVPITSATLQKGRNTLAVEIHPDAKNPALYLDLSLRTDERRASGSVAVTDAARPATMAYYKEHYIPTDMTVPDGYVDGGRRMVIGKNAVVLSTREILVIDRSKDPALRQQLAYAKDPELLKLPTAERAKKLAQYVDKILSPGGDRAAALQAVEEFTEAYANRPVLFGEMEEACQSGVCRHRALLFKMLCDDAGLKSALVRGNFKSRSSSGGHAWNELLLDDGSRVIVDVMNPLPDFAFLPETSRTAKHYLSVKDEDLYPRKTEAKP